jgi:hypothetical protein
MYPPVTQFPLLAASALACKDRGRRSQPKKEEEMKTSLHTTIRHLGVLLATATALAAVAAGPALAKDRPLYSYYKPQDLQRMSDSWAARGGILTNVPASSYYRPQQIQTMSASWAARYRYEHAEARERALARARAASESGLDWGDFGVGAAAMLGLVLLAGGLAAGVHHSRKGRVQPRPAS